MGTKVHNGFHLQNTTLEDALLLARRFRKENYLPKASHLMANTVAGIALSTHDQIALGLLPESTLECQSPIQYALNEFVRRYEKVKTTSGRDPSVDMDCEIVFFTDKNQTYGIIFTEQSALRDEWKLKSGAQNFSYWNVEDQPDGVSSEEWRQRKLTWDRIFKDTSIPAECGFTVSFKNPPYPSRDSILEFARQKNRVSNEIVMEVLLDMISKKDPSFVASTSFILSLQNNPDFENVKRALNEKLIPGQNLEALSSYGPIEKISVDLDKQNLGLRMPSIPRLK